MRFNKQDEFIMISFLQILFHIYIYTQRITQTVYDLLGDLTIT